MQAPKQMAEAAWPAQDDRRGPSSPDFWKPVVQAPRPWALVLAGLVVGTFLIYLGAVFGLISLAQRLPTRVSADRAVGWMIAGYALYVILTGLLFALRLDRAASVCAWLPGLAAAAMPLVTVAAIAFR